MKLTTGLAAVIAPTCLLISAAWAQQSGIISWAPKPLKATGWKAPNKPLTKLSDLLAKHKGQADWRETVVSDEMLHADYISMGPGAKTPPRFHPDTREWWVIQDGQIQFTIEGQEPFTASKGWLVQVPFRRVYSMETVGTQPSLRFEVNVANTHVMYPVDDKPPAMPGFEFVKVKLSGAKGTYDRGNKPYLIFPDLAAKFETTPKKSGGARFINDDRAVSNVIYGHASNLPPAKDADLGHFHEECAEFWFILLGQMEYKLEGIPNLVIANQGDIVYAPRLTWHRPRFHGDGPACRLAMNGYPDIGHNFQAEIPENVSSR